MIERLRAWWQRTKGPLEIIFVSAFLVGLVVLIVIIIFGYKYGWDWTGLGPVNSEPKQHMKTLWDWLQLLIIPAVLAVGGYVFNLTVSRNEQKSTQLRDQTEREIASDNQREAALQSYIDKMSELLLEKKLRDSAEDDEIRKIARVRTLTVLRGLDSIRKASVIQFLYESGLISKNKYIVDLLGADLEKANLAFLNLNGAYLASTSMEKAVLSFTNLSVSDLTHIDLGEADLVGAVLLGARLIEAQLIGANLSGAILREADLRDADLRGADLRGADLEKANMEQAIVTQEQLTKAKSLQGARMPDGSIHP